MLSSPGLTRSRACPTPALLNDRKRKHPISIGDPVNTGRGYWIARSSRAMTPDRVNELKTILGAGQRLLDLGLHDLHHVFRRDRPHQLVGDLAVAPDDEGFRNAINAPFDRSASVGVGARSRERIAVAAAETSGVVGLVFVIDTDHPDAGIAGKLHQQRGLVMTWHAP